MVEPRFRWTFRRRRRPRSPTAVDAAPAHGISTRMAGILAPAGPSSADEIVAWFARPARRPPRPARCCPTPACPGPPDRPRATAGERVLVFGDFDADGLTGLAIMTLALRRFGIDGRAVRAEPARGGPRPVAGGASMRPRRVAARVIVTVDCGSTSVAEIAAADARGIDVIVTDHHRVPGGLPAAARRRQPASAGLDLPGPPPGGQRRRLQGRPAAARERARRSAGRPRPGRPRDDRIGRRRGPDRRARTGRSPGSGWNGCAARRGPASRRCSSGPASRPTAIDLETVGFAIAPRLNAAGRVGEALEAARLLLATDPAEAAVHADAPRGREPDPTRPDEVGRRRGARRSSAESSPDDAADRSCAARGPSGSSGWSPPGWPRTVAGPRSSGRSSATSSAPRAGATARSTWARPSTLRRPLHPARRPCRGGRLRAAGRPLGRVPRAVPGHRRRGASRPTRGRPSPSTWPCRRSTSTTGCTASWPVSRRAGRATPSRSSRSSA